MNKTIEISAKKPVETAITKGITLDRAVGEFIASNTKITNETIQCDKCGKEIKQFVTEINEEQNIHPQCFAETVIEYIRNNQR